MLFLCTYEDLLNNPVQICQVSADTNDISIILLWDGNKVRAFRNRCPHAWVPLDAVDPQIISGCKQYLQCSSHFAQFRMQDGYCIYGPCEGRSLYPLGITVKDGKIFLTPASQTLT